MLQRSDEMNAYKHVFDKLDNCTLIRLIYKYIRPRLYRDVIKMRLVDGLTYQEISDATYKIARKGYSIRQVQNIVRQCETKLIKYV
jgi:hypothetical protein